ncbi:hypothetical protein HYT57_05860 [Candidatus Woesearchaeota archaeon]|nr:hypothetical protein [Candidatus Woesearchaeota archaeon]
MKRINYAAENNKNYVSHHNRRTPYLLILATAASLTLGALESLPKLLKGYTKPEIEESIKEKRGNWACLTYPGRAFIYTIYNIPQERRNLEENSLSQIIEETPIR